MPEAAKALKKMAVWVAVIIICDLLRMAEIVLLPLPRNPVSAFYLPVLSIFLIHYFSTHIVARNGLRFCLQAVAWLIFIFIILREIKYNTFFVQDWVCRYLWYSYYVPILLIPLFSFYAAVMINANDDARLPEQWVWLVFAAAVLILFIFTNDFHQQVYRFQEHFENWNSEYTCRWGYFLMLIWQYGLYLASLAIMIRKCRISHSGYLFWIPLIPLAIGVLLMAAVIFGFSLQFHGQPLLGYPELLCFTVALFWETCMQIGLIPTNENYGRILQKLSLPVWITSEEGTVIYHSDSAETLTDEQSRINGDIFLDRNTILHGRSVPGGFGIWKEDITEINEVQQNLKQLQENLEEEAVLIRLENERKEEKEHIDQQNLLYDSIARMTREQSKVIHDLAEVTESAEDETVRKRNVILICFYGAYIKRISNLMLSGNTENIMGTGELYLSVLESFRYLEKAGVKCTFGEHAEALCASKSLIAAYRIFETLTEQNLHSLKGVFAAVREAGDGLVFRIVMEGAGSCPFEALKAYADGYGIDFCCEAEDENLYIRIRIAKGGEES